MADFYIISLNQGVFIILLKYNVITTSGLRWTVVVTGCNYNKMTCWSVLEIRPWFQTADFYIISLNQGVFIILLKYNVITTSCLRGTVVVTGSLQNNARSWTTTRWRGNQCTAGSGWLWPRVRLLITIWRRRPWNIVIQGKMLPRNMFKISISEKNSSLVLGVVGSDSIDMPWDFRINTKRN